MRDVIAPLGLIVMEGMEELGEKIHRYLKTWADESGIDADSLIVKAECPRFSTGDSKGLIQSTIRGRDLFILVDVGNYSVKYPMFGVENRMSPDDHFQNLKRIISAASGKPTA
jgi:ribose-phosphate pyrophosphokinase